MKKISIAILVGMFSASFALDIDVNTWNNGQEAVFRDTGMLPLNIKGLKSGFTYKITLVDSSQAITTVIPIPAESSLGWNLKKGNGNYIISFESEDSDQPDATWHLTFAATGKKNAEINILVTKKKIEESKHEKVEPVVEAAQPLVETPKTFKKQLDILCGTPIGGPGGFKLNEVTNTKKLSKNVKNTARDTGRLAKKGLKKVGKLF